MKLLDLFKAGLFLAGSCWLLSGCAKANDPVTPDVTNPRLTIEKVYSVQGYARDLDIRDSLLFIAEDQAGFSIYNLNADTLLSRYFNSEFGNIRLVKAFGKYLFVYNKYGSGSTAIIAYNVTNPAQPVKIFPIIGDTQDITELQVEPDLNDSGAVLLQWSNAKRFRYNVKFKDFYQGGPSFPFADDYLFSIEGFAKDNSCVYFAGGAGRYGIQTATIDSGVIINQFRTNGEALDVAVCNKTVYAALREEGILALNMQNPRLPVVLYRYNTTGYAQNIDCSEKYLAVASGSGGVYVFDVINQQQIKFIGSLDESDIGYTYKVKIVGDFVYAATKTGLVKIKINS